MTAILTGCGTMRNGRGWGQDATIAPGWDRLRAAAVHAVKAPEVWAPALGAALLQIGDADEEISEWAVDKTPIFGSIENADDASDVLVDVGGGLFIAAALAAPSGGDPKVWLWSKTKGLAVGFASLAITSLPSFATTIPDGPCNTSPKSGIGPPWASTSDSPSILRTIEAAGNVPPFINAKTLKSAGGIESTAAIGPSP